jgi:hypothetical protein
MLAEVQKSAEKQNFSKQIIKAKLGVTHFAAG